ncbi:MAG: isoprenyl transferase [Endomicrobiales bacterium]|nr:isoprenyl transferase [Endomicrobiales bacterium]
MANELKAKDKQGIDLSNLPSHVAIIMDGNGRWAKKRGFPRVYGHKKGVENVREIVETCADLGVKVLTLYAFSTENWIRPKSEIAGLMSLLGKYLVSEEKTLNDNNIRLRTIGDTGALPKPQRELLEKTMRSTEKNTGMVLNLALNYGSRQEIIRAFGILVEKGVQRASEQDISSSLYTAGLPDPDLLIRTSGEQRLSNFLLWQMAYGELYITDVLWPDFKPQELYKAIKDFQSRHRRFGGIKAVQT